MFLPPVQSNVRWLACPHLVLLTRNSTSYTNLCAVHRLEGHTGGLETLNGLLQQQEFLMNQEGGLVKVRLWLGSRQ
jgi:hypothetical protein